MRRLSVAEDVILGDLGSWDVAQVSSCDGDGGGGDDDDDDDDGDGDDDDDDDDDNDNDDDDDDFDDHADEPLLDI